MVEPFIGFPPRCVFVAELHMDVAITINTTNSIKTFSFFFFFLVKQSTPIFTFGILFQNWCFRDENDENDKDNDIDNNDDGNDNAKDTKFRIRVIIRILIFIYRETFCRRGTNLPI